MGNSKLFKQVPEHDKYECPRCRNKYIADNIFNVMGDWNFGLCVFCGTEANLLQMHMKHRGENWRELDERIRNNS